MTTEEKAKRYDEAIERANELNYVSDKDSLQCKTVEHIFPELKKNVREEIITYLSTVEDKELIPYESWIAWLEKQGEQKTAWGKEDEMYFEYIRVAVKKQYPMASKYIVKWLKSLKDRIYSKQSNKPQGKTALEGIKEEKVDNANKVESKLHVDTWVVRKDGRNFSDRRKAVQITDIKIEEDKYFLDTGTWANSNEIRPWSIADAENGDILAVENIIFIYKRILSSHIVSHCKLFCGKFEPFEDTRTCSESNPYVHPATQKQRDLFFLGLNTSGYEWNTVNKKLKKTEIKFHEGDWIVTSENEVLHITSIEDTSYRFNNESHYWETYYCDNECHLWTLNDAKDGDVLATSTGAPFIYNGNNGGGSCPGSYCGINTLGNFKTGTETHWTGKTVNPATKEQRNLLFEKMKEAGYEWDNEKKELKKQGEQKLVGKTETKFKDGDWIVYSDAVWQVCNIALQNYYELLKTNNEVCIRLIKEVDENAHLWTIDDAKDGDVLVESKEDVILMFRGIGNTKWDDVIDYHCYYSCPQKTFYVQKGVEYWGNTNGHELKPSTKEQRELLFSKMKEAGYIFDFEKKEMKKLPNSYCQENCKGFQETGKCFADWDCKAKIESESTDKVETKFKVGDWIVCCDYEPVQIVGIRMNAYYEMSNGDSRPIYMVDNNPNIRLWTIQDAKDGDIIYAESRDDTFDFVCIFSKLENEKSWVYCSVATDSDYLGNDLKRWDFDDYAGFINLYNYDFYLATKEQRDILLQKMKEAGYEWVLKPKVEIKRRNDDDKI